VECARKDRRRGEHRTGAGRPSPAVLYGIERRVLGAQPLPRFAHRMTVRTSVAARVTDPSFPLTERFYVPRFAVPAFTLKIGCALSTLPPAFEN